MALRIYHRIKNRVGDDDSQSSPTYYPTYIPLIALTIIIRTMKVTQEIEV